jgi:formate hydrogenlyase subunit 3/multisubunit Na+/H+ antiporter MnhD subunit
MSNWFLILPWLVPLLLLPVPSGRAVRWLPVFATLPALATALFAPDNLTAELGWLLMGTHLGIDNTGRLFLFFSSLTWFTAALYSLLRPSLATCRGRFRIAFLLAMSGNFLLIVAADMLSFYLGFALMGISAYGMIVAPGTAAAIKAGRRYLGWTIAGELVLFSGMVLLASRAAGTGFSDLAAVEPGMTALVLIMLGFGVKMALPGLHFWLPSTYRAAPAAAAAVLAGPMLAAGLLGWLRFLSPATATNAATLFLTLGIAGALLGLAGGLLQRDARGVLAWSSIAKAGTMTAILGTAFASPAASPAILFALSLFAIHHLLIKSFFFLGMGELESQGRNAWLIAGLALLALSLAGAPWSGGAASKELLISGLGNDDSLASMLFMVMAIGTAMLMTRFIWLALYQESRKTSGDAITIGWFLLAIPATWLPYDLLQAGFSASAMLTLLAGIGLFAVTRSLVIGQPGPMAMPGMRLNTEGIRSLQSSVSKISHAALHTLRRSLVDPGIEKRLAVGATTALVWLTLFVMLLTTLIAPD